MAGSVVPAFFQSGFRLFSGEQLNAGSQNSYEDGITAKAGGVQANAYLLTGNFNRISVCANNGDSVKLPPSSPGEEIVVINDGAATAQVYGFGTDTIDGVATATGVTVSNAKRAIFWCVTAGKWQSLGGGPAA